MNEGSEAFGFRGKSMKRKQWAIATMAVITAIVLAVTYKPLLVAYHHSAMERSFNTATNQFGTGSDGEIGAWDAYHRHRERLLELGHFVRLTYKFPHDLKLGARQWEIIRELVPEYNWIEKQHKTNTLSVWCAPDEVEKWNALVELVKAKLRDEGYSV